MQNLAALRVVIFESWSKRGERPISRRGAGSPAARGQAATICRFVCLSTTERDCKAIFACHSIDRPPRGHACGDWLIVHQPQRPLDGIQEKRQYFPDTLYFRQCEADMQTHLHMFVSALSCFHQCQGWRNMFAQVYA